MQALQEWQVYGTTRDGELYGLRNTEKHLRSDLANARSEIEHLRRQVHRLIRLPANCRLTSCRLSANTSAFFDMQPMCGKR